MAPGFEEVELTAPVDILRRLGIDVVLVGVEALTVEGAHGITMRADMLLVDVDAGKIGGVILPGGKAAWQLRETPAVLALVREMHAAKKTVAAICAAPIVLEAAGVLAKRSITCYPAPDVRSGVASAKAVADDRQVVVDGHIITARGPGAALEFGFVLGAQLGCAARIAELKSDMCC